MDFKVGNGGCSLRTRQVMLKCIDVNDSEFSDQLEDVFFCNTIQKLKLGLIASFEEALKFGEEHVNSLKYHFVVSILEIWKFKIKKY